MTTKIYGIKNCDTMKKAFRWLEDHEIEFEFHDYKKSGLPESLAKQWVKEIDLEQLINKRGTTWRKIDDAVKQNLTKSSAVELLVNNTSVIKRPLLEVDGEYHLGFNADLYSEIFN